jgi:hypothetical protein
LGIIPGVDAMDSDPCNARSRVPRRIEHQSNRYRGACRRVYRSVGPLGNRCHPRWPGGRDHLVVKDILIRALAAQFIFCDLHLPEWVHADTRWFSGMAELVSSPPGIAVGSVAQALRFPAPILQRFGFDRLQFPSVLTIGCVLFALIYC